MNDPEEAEVAKEAALLLAYAKAHNEERETAPADQQRAPAPVAPQQPGVVARQRPTTASTTPPTLQEDLVTALLSELRQSRQERELERQERATLLHEVATMRRQLDTLQGTAPVPAWLLEVTSNPRAYDAHNPTRVQFNGRLPPEKLRQLQQLKNELSIRTQAGLIEDMATVYLAVRAKTRC